MLSYIDLMKRLYEVIFMLTAVTGDTNFCTVPVVHFAVRQNFCLFVCLKKGGFYYE